MRLACLLFSLPLFAQQTLTLRQAEERALQNHPRLAAAKLSADAAQWLPKQMHAATLPTLNGVFSSSVADHLSRVGAGGLNASSLFSRVGMGINVSHLVYDFGRNRTLIDAARLRATSESDQTRVVRNEILLRVRQTYYSALLAAKMNEATRQVLESRKVLFKQVSSLAANQLKSTLDQSFAELGVTEAELELERGINAYRAALTDLSAAMGDQDAKETSYTLEDPPALPDPSSDLTALIAEATRSRPEVTVARRNIDALRRQLDAEKKVSLPALSLLGVGGFIPAGDPRLRTRYGGLGLNLTVPLFNGDLTKTRTGEAQLRLQAAEQSLRDLHVRIERDLKVALIEASNAANRVTTTGKYKDQAAKTVRLAQVRYDLGLGSIVELTQAQTVRLTAEIQNAAALYEHQLRLASVEFQLGR